MKLSIQMSHILKEASPFVDYSNFENKVSTIFKVKAMMGLSNMHSCLLLQLYKFNISIRSDR